MPYAVAGGALAAVGTVAGGLMQSSAASKAQAQAQQKFEQQRADLAPYRDAAQPALQAQGALLGLQGQPAADAAMANYQTSPGYTWQMKEGLRGVDAGAAALGMTRSGATIKGEEQFAQGLANSDFGTYYNRLMGLTTLGANAAAGQATNVGQAASAALGGGTAQSSIYGNTASSLATNLGGLLQNKDVQGTLSGLFGSGYSGPSANALLGGGGSPDYLQGQLGLASNQYVP